jgi:hypothetical protein
MRCNKYVSSLMVFTYFVFVLGLPPLFEPRCSSNTT